jgi:hypothetical protein
MQIDRDALVAYYRNRDLEREAQRARLANLVSARQKSSALWALLVNLACRLQIRILEPACALGPAS